jgi:hypothetical protein
MSTYLQDGLANARGLTYRFEASRFVDKSPKTFADKSLIIADLDGDRLLDSHTDPSSPYHVL